MTNSPTTPSAMSGIATVTNLVMPPNYYHKLKVLQMQQTPQSLQPKQASNYNHPPTPNRHPTTITLNLNQGSNLKQVPNPKEDYNLSRCPTPRRSPRTHNPPGHYTNNLFNYTPWKRQRYFRPSRCCQKIPIPGRRWIQPKGDPNFNQGSQPQPRLQPQ